jgi:hypothetical protein
MYIEIRKPIYGNYCAIQESKLRQAIKNKEALTIKTPNGEATVCPRWWIEKGDRMEKVFNFPDRPMILYANHAPIESEEDKLKTLSLFT